jgi:hypothetical protein
MEGKLKQIRRVMRRVVIKKESVNESSNDEGYKQNKVEFIKDEFFESNRKKIMVVVVMDQLSDGGGGMRCCQVENCIVDLTYAKQYHNKHKVFKYHTKGSGYACNWK